MKIQELTPAPAMLLELGRRLAMVRRQRGQAQEELARAAGVGVATLRRIEDGHDARLGSWLRLLQAAGLVAAVDQLVPEEVRSPRAEVLGGKRRRAPRASAGPDAPWGDEQP
jgi:transcriptional regulator with XRE-family HTH domain